MANAKSTRAKGSRLSLILQSKQESIDDIADWGKVTGSLLVDLVQVVTRLGGAVRFGYTRDGGAYSIGLYLDDDRETFYCKPDSDLDGFITNLTELLRDA